MLARSVKRSDRTLPGKDDSSLKMKQFWSDGAEHFDCVLNRPSSINEEAINRLPQVDMNESLAEPPTSIYYQVARRLEPTLFQLKYTKQEDLDWLKN
jgi:hypothetical protein